MTLLAVALLHSTPLKFHQIRTRRPWLPPLINKSFPISWKFNSKQPRLGIPVSNCSSSPKNKESSSSSQRLHHQYGFCALESDGVPWEIGSVWTTMGFYLFSLHIPMSFGGLAIVAQFLNQPNLGPETKSVSVLAIQSLELLCALLLLQYTSKPPHQDLISFLIKPNKKSESNQKNQRNWLLSSLLGFMFLIFTVFCSSLLADQLVGTKPVNNLALKEILSSGNNISVISIFLVYCVVTPILEEVMYRGFLLTSLASSSSMDWRIALVVSSAVFSASHLSAENSLQLFVIGLVLGSSYCWTANLASSIALHSMYNVFTLVITLLAAA